MTGTVLQFIPNVARRAEGLSDAGIEQFRDNPYVSCARETGQNTNDAPDAGIRPVRMKFDLRVIPRTNVPFADELRLVAKACLDESREFCEKANRSPAKDRTVKFFERAVLALSEKSLEVLEIADFNTTGLTGPFDDDYCVFNSLVKAKGVTNKPNVDSGGSFGIGKNAVFAVSDVQTVLYATKAKNLQNPDRDDIYGFQARTVLISHEAEDGPKTAEGYWGLPDYYPIEDPSTMPQWMVRESRGTSVFAICFRHHESWAERMALSIATNFPIAVMRGDMEFEIDDGRIAINKSTLATTLQDASLEKTAKDTNQLVALERARNILECLSSEIKESFELNVNGFGKALLHILVQEDLPRQVNIMRNGMYITSSLKDFGCPMVSFPGTREFVAVLEPKPGDSGKQLGELLKRMENPEHDNFSPERLRDDKERQKVTRLIKALHRDIRTKIKSAAKVAESDQSDLDELAKLFAADPDTGDTKDGVEEDPESYVYGKAKSTRKKPVTSSSKTGGAAGGAGGSGGKGKGSGGGKGRGTGGGTGGSGHKGVAKPIKLQDCRVRMEPHGSAYSHRIIFTPDRTSHGRLRISAAGLTGTSSLRVSGAEHGDLNTGSIDLDLQEGVRVSIGVIFEDTFEGPLELACVDKVEEADS